MTTEKQTKNTTTSDNKVIFGPLGKYAVVAIIMVSIIVTTAIMLERELNTIDQQVAEIEAEIAESNKKNLNAGEVTASTDIENIAISAEAAPQTNAAVEKPAADIPDASKAENIAIVKETQMDSKLAVETTDAIEEVSAKPELATAAPTEETAASSPVSAIEKTHAVVQAKSADRNKAREEARRARIDEFKLEQKSRMTELLSRIKALESEQLDRYKASQQGQVTRLREQVARQQKMIEALILRNKDHYELRSANIQRNQTRREQILDRI